MKNEKLIRAMGEIDEDLILEAHESKKPRMLWMRWSALAACLAVVILCLPGLLHGLTGASKADMEMDMVGQDLYYSATGGNGVPAEATKDELQSDISMNGYTDGIKDIIQNLINGGASSEKAEEMPECGESLYCYRVGETAQVYGMTVQYVSADESSITLAVNKTNDTPLVLSVTAMDENSSRSVSTEKDGEYFAMTVNGERVKTLPHEAGDYDITVDFSAILQDKGWQIDERVIIGDNVILIWEQGG